MTGLFREARVSGKFYPGKISELDKLFEMLFLREKNKINYSLSEKKIIGAILPHAGYIYSGYQAIHFFEILAKSEEVFDTFVIIHPNHRSNKYAFASDECKKWIGPYGSTPLDIEFIEALEIPVSESFHKYEHSGEVMLPFLQKYIDYPMQIVPISIGKQNPEHSSELSGKLSHAVNKTGRKICLIVSSDFSHYVSVEYGKKADQKVLDKILGLDSAAVYKEIMENDISVCGYGPIMTLIDYSKENYPDTVAKILARGHSGEIFPSSEVVHYISLLFYTNK